ncbi:hypothetical protein B9Z55_016911 [Caenorhabditis nigoni]|uniref:7TM GPCR serpentine receptor class x (Srx) domain-containing protein n=1 Tax=Caenorhabditis nigoni TaxID=1611254 RepID=A0A2G5T7A2_9PELO|nr:hypothetical protein B9Z55_016911 [Caenorhabditis nigoni]
MDFLNKIASVLVLLNGLLGSGFNILVIYIYFNGSQDKNSFNFICLTRAINNIIVLAFNFLLLTFPVVLIKLSDSRLWAFVSTVFVWESIHTLDGLIMLMFSDRISVLRAKFARILDRDNQVSSSSWMGRSRRAVGASSLPGVA